MSYGITNYSSTSNTWLSNGYVTSGGWYMDPDLNRHLNHTHSITLPTYKEPEMTTLEKIKQQRREERERGRIERMYAEYDESGLSGVDVGTVATFTWAPDEEHSYRYAALFADDEKWYLTGGRSVQGVGYEDFVAWLIEKDIEAANLTWWDAS